MAQFNASLCQYNDATGEWKMQGTGITLGPNASIGPLVARTVALASAATITLDSTQGSVFTHVPTQSETINATVVAPAGQVVYLVVTTSGTTSFTLTFGTNFKTTATLATGIVSAKVFTMVFISDGVNLNEIARSVAM